MASITLFGSTGLIGNEILKLLEKDDYFKNINVISRREIKLKSKKSKLKLIEPEVFAIFSMLVRHGPSDFPWPGKSIAKMLKFLFDKYCSVKDQTICVNPLP